MNRRDHLVAVAVAGALCGSVSAQYVSGFEADDSVTASDVGTELNGQDAYYLPDSGGVSGAAYTYDGNLLGIRQNPHGGDQFIGSVGPGGAVFSRSQRDVTFGEGSSIWRSTYDIKVTFGGKLPSAQNVGSYSVQRTPGGSDFTIILLAAWTDPATAATWNADMIWFDAIGTQVQESIPDPAFQMLETDTWFRQSVVFDIKGNTVLQVSLVNLETGDSAVYTPPDRYMAGGAGMGFLPTGFRFFAGASGVAGNTIAWDNLAIRQGGDVNGDGVVDVDDMLSVLAAWDSGDFRADLDADGFVGVLDLLQVLANWSS